MGDSLTHRSARTSKAQTAEHWVLPLLIIDATLVICEQGWT